MRLMKAHSGFVLILLVSSFLIVDVSVAAPNLNYIEALIANGENAVSALGKLPENWITELYNLLAAGKYNEFLEKVKQPQEALERFIKAYNYIEEQNNESRSTVAPNSADIISAWKMYQKNFNLKVTGQPDEETFELLKQPRCGVPDIIDGRNTMDAAEADMTPFKPWWKSGENNVTYAFEDNMTALGKSLFQGAFDRWSKETALNFTEITEFNASDIRIDIGKWDGNGGRVGATFTNYTSGVGVMYLDVKEQVAILPNVLMHQIGHLLGLEHSSVKESIMYPIVMQEKVELTDEDRKRVQPVKKNSDSGSASTRGTDNSGGDGGIDCSVWQRNLVLGFAFMVFGIFLME